MNQAEMEAEIISRTGLPRAVVRQVIDALKAVMNESILRQQDIVFRGMFRISSALRERSAFTTPPGAAEPSRAKESKLVLGIRPTRDYRQELNAWTSTLSFSMKSTSKPQ